MPHLRAKMIRLAASLPRGSNERKALIKVFLPDGVLDNPRFPDASKVEYSAVRLPG